MKPDLLIPQPVKLGFDPDKVTDPELQAVISNPTAWLIWLMWKPRHVTSQHFNETCLKIAARIEKWKPSDMAEMTQCFHGPDFGPYDVQNWIKEAYLYLIGTLTLRIELPPAANTEGTR